VSDLIDAVDCIELEEVGNWRQGPVHSKVVNIEEVKDDVQLEGLLVLPCYDIETEEGHEGTTTVMGFPDDEAENEREREGICDACLGSVIIGETCVCSVDLSDELQGREQEAGGLAAGQGREQDAGGLAAGQGREQDADGLAAGQGREQDAGGFAADQSREKVDCMYHIMTENEGDYLYLEAGTPVSKEGSDVSRAEEVWDLLGIGVIEPTTVLEWSQTWTDGQPPTSKRPKEPLRISDQGRAWMDDPPPAPDEDQSRTAGPLLISDQGQAWMDDPPPARDENQSRTAGPLQISDQGRALNSAQECEVMALEPGMPESDGEFQALFENTLGFPTARRPIDSLRRVYT